MTAYRFTGIVTGLVIGIVLAAHTTWLLPVGVLVLLFCGGASLQVASGRAERHWVAWPRSVVFLTACVLALPLGYQRTRQVLEPANPLSLRTHLANVPAGQRLILRGTIATEPEWRGRRQVDLTLRVRALRGANADTTTEWTPVRQGRVRVRVYAYRTNRPETLAALYALARPTAYGDEIEVAANYDPGTPPRNPHQFDYPAYLRTNGIETSLRTHIAHVNVLAKRHGNPLTTLALMAKTHFLETFKRTIRAPASRIAAAATLGARRSVEDVDYRGHNITEMFRHAGVGHVLAVSGLHVSVIAVLLFALFRMTGASPKVFVPPLIFFLILFALLTGARPSSVRAVVMNSVILFTIAYFRCNLRTATAIGLSASAFLILLDNPLLLFAPSFLLSYGAVLSLIVLAPPFDRFLCTLRGCSAGFFLLWFAALMAIAGWRFHWLTQPLHLLGLAGVLWLLMLLGTRINHAFPRLWNTGFARIPPLLRMFLAAQLAIQIGMMLPLSAWFFGRFPVAGILVNLVAIPTVGILVQLGMLLGLIGMIPLLGPLIALPFGAATTLVGDFFLWIAYSGAALFPFPAMPQPSIAHLTLYYGCVALILLLEHNRHLLLDQLYRLPARSRLAGQWLPASAPVAACTLIALPLLLHPRGLPLATHLQVLASRRYPLITIHGRHKADIINAGSRFEGARLLFDHLRAKGSVSIHRLYLPAPDPAAGLEGAAALAPLMPIEHVILPVHPSQGQSFTDALGDDYLARHAAEGTRWAVQYNTAYDALWQMQQEQGNPRTWETFTDTPEPSWQNVHIRPLPRFTGPVDRFATSARTPILQADLHGQAWIIISDTTPEALAAALGPTAPACTVLVVSDISTRASFFPWLRTAVEKLSPALVILGGEHPIAWNASRQAWIQTCREKGIQWIETGRDGAVSTTFRRDGSTLLETCLTQRRITLPAERQAP